MSRQSLAIALTRQRWLPYKTRRSLIKRIHPDMLRDYAFEADFFGMKFRGNIVNYIDRLVYFCGGHEKYMLLCLRDYVKRLRQAGESRLSFVDVGANAGNHALFMAPLVDQVHAFEPFERVRRQLEENLALNHIHNVRVYPFGLSDREATMPFYSGPDSNLGAASFNPSHKQDNYYLGDLHLKRGDEVMKEAGIDKVDIIKADVEGFEKFVLEGLKETLRRDRPLVIIELSESTRKTLGSEAALLALFPADYRYYYFARGKHDSGAYALKPFDYALKPKIEDVIACPAERLNALGISYKR